MKRIKRPLQRDGYPPETVAAAPVCRSPAGALPAEGLGGEPGVLRIYYVGHMPVSYEWSRLDPAGNIVLGDQSKK